MKQYFKLALLSIVIIGSSSWAGKSIDQDIKPSQKIRNYTFTSYSKYVPINAENRQPQAALDVLEEPVGAGAQ